MCYVIQTYNFTMLEYIFKVYFCVRILSIN